MGGGIGWGDLSEILLGWLISLFHCSLSPWTNGCTAELQSWLCFLLQRNHRLSTATPHKVPQQPSRPPQESTPSVGGSVSRPPTLTPAVGRFCVGSPQNLGGWVRQIPPSPPLWVSRALGTKQQGFSPVYTRRNQSSICSCEYFRVFRKLSNSRDWGILGFWPGLSPVPFPFAAFGKRLSCTSPFCSTFAYNHVSNTVEFPSEQPQQATQAEKSQPQRRNQGKHVCCSISDDMEPRNMGLKCNGTQP